MRCDHIWRKGHDKERKKRHSKYLYLCQVGISLKRQGLCGEPSLPEQKISSRRGLGSFRSPDSGTNAKLKYVVYNTGASFNHDLEEYITIHLHSFPSYAYTLSITHTGGPIHWELFCQLTRLYQTTLHISIRLENTTAIPNLSAPHSFYNKKRFLIHFLLSKIVTMVFGISVSYHRSQVASTTNIPRDPICPCSRCFDRIGHLETRRACDSPAKEFRWPRSRQISNSIGRSRSRLGLGLRRWRSVDSVGSDDMRPLRNGGRKIAAESVDGQSILAEKI